MIAEVKLAVAFDIAQKVDMVSWNWKPCVSIDEFIFGAVFAPREYEVEIEKLPPSYEDADWDTYRVGDEIARVSVYDSRIDRVECSKSIKPHFESIDQAAELPGANSYAAALANARLRASLVVERPIEEVASLLRESLAVIPPFNPARLAISGAASADYPELRCHYERELAEFLAHPDENVRAIG